MKQYSTVITGKKTVNFAPPDMFTEVVQNIQTIISTPKYSVPLFREFGLDGDIVDAPSLEASAKLKSDIIMAVRKYEPRAVIKRIDFVPDNDGKLALKLKINLKED